MKLIIIVAMLLSCGAFANNYCDSADNPFYFQQQAQERHNRLSFTNEGGAFDVGVCWWHSRFQRAALYLTIFNPNAPRPSKDQLKKLIKKIKSQKQMVIIPGYSSLYEFSMNNRDLIQKVLEDWQITNTLLFQWISGLTGVTQNTPQNMNQRMKELYRQVSRGDVVYQKLQLKGIDAHAWLVIGMEKFDGGYELQVIDSNYSYVKSFSYYDGDPGIYHAPYGGYFVPYIEKNDELSRLKKISLEYCK